MGYDPGMQLFKELLCMMTQFLVDSGNGYHSSFSNLPDIPLYPYEFSCSRTANSLMDCSQYTASCYYSYTSSYGDYFGLTCQGM